MPPKKAPARAKPQTLRKAEIVDEAPLQAVVLADSYNRRFEVLCAERPRILLPLCSIPLLTWTLEALSLSRVKQVFLFCGVHADQIRDFVETCPYRQTMDIQCLSSSTAHTPGDALRELDSMGVLSGDNPFILIHSPLVGNYDLRQMVNAHRKRREVDSNYIMTMGVGRGGRRHPESPIMLVHPPSNRLLHYTLHPLLPSSSRISFPADLFLDPFPPTIDSYEIWSGASSSSGYRDLGVDICELDVPALCTENFDYHDLRRHFVNGVLTSELLGKKIAVHLAGSEVEDGESKGNAKLKGRYIERVRDTRTYADLAKDVMRRWAFPLAPDLFYPGQNMPYELRTGNIYISRDNVMLSRTTVLNGPLLIGNCSILQANTLIRESTLGSFTSLGPHSTVSHSYVFDNVRIGANCHLSQCIIGNAVEIADNVVIGKGALVGDGVKLGKGCRVPDFARIGLKMWVPEEWGDDDVDEEHIEEQEALRRDTLGLESVGYVWPQEEQEPASDSEDEAEDPYEHPRNKQLLQLGRTLSNLTSSTSSLSTLSKASSSGASTPETYASDASDLPNIPSLNLNTTTGPSAAFTSEAISTLQRGYEEGYDVENIGTEMGLLFPAYNAGVDSARRAIINFVLSQIDITIGPREFLGEATKKFAYWSRIFPKFTADYINLVLDMQAYVVNNEAAASLFPHLLRAAYEADLLDETVLLRWRGDKRGKDGDEIRIEEDIAAAAAVSKGEKGVEGGKSDAVKRWKDLYAKGKVFVDALEEMESDDDDDEEDDEAEDDDEESEEED